MMKLRLAVPLQDLPYRFRIGITVVSNIFHRWLDVMRELKQLIVWPDHGILRETLPECFKPNYTGITCIINCSEVFIERPSSLSASSETYSNYKSHNTVKFLVAVSPAGAVIFVSKCWGGRVSDRHLTVHSGFLDKLSNRDLWCLQIMVLTLQMTLPLLELHLQYHLLLEASHSFPKEKWKFQEPYHEFAYMLSVQ